MFEKIIAKLNKANTVGIFTHVNPDGDAMGSAYALKLALSDMGKNAEVFLCGGIEDKLSALIKGFDGGDADVEKCDMLIALDCADARRLGKWQDVFALHTNTAAVDHHVTHIKFAEETVVCDVSSTCELMWLLFKEMHAELSVDAATNVYIGMATDTGNFKYSSVTGDTHRIAAELIDMGIDFAEVSKRIFDTVTREYLALKAKAVNSLKYFGDGRISMLTLKNFDFEEFGVKEENAAGIVTLPTSIEGVEVGVYIRQRGENEYKVSLRSARYVDVAKIAETFGGGGHVRAAGYSVMDGKLEDNIERLIAEIEKRL